MGLKKSKEADDKGSDNSSNKSDGKKEGKSGKKGKKQKVLQVLVAGAAQSGKSTFFKQLQLIHFNGFSDECEPIVNRHLTRPDSVAFSPSPSLAPF